MNEREIDFVSAGLQLSGTLALPEGPGPFACVLMLPGSGEVDRDENHAKLRLNVLRELAEYLAARGIASLRYDKRGVGRSQGDYWRTGFYDHAADAEAALEFLRGLHEPAVGKLFLLGHSEGAYLSVRVAAESPDLAGIVLLAGGARTGEEELRWQARQVADSLTGFNAFLIRLLHIDVLKAQTKHFDKIKRSNQDFYRVQLVQKINVKWMREFLAYDPGPDLAKILVPFLAITGAKDIQVDPGNLEQMARLVTAPFESHVLPDVTHLLRSEPGRAGLATYKKQIKRPVDSRVLSLIAGWLERQSHQEAGISVERL